MLDHGNRLHEHWPKRFALLAFLSGLSPPKNKNTGTTHPPSGELAVPANDRALTKNDVHVMNGLALLAPETQIGRVSRWIKSLLGFLLADRANIQAVFHC